MASVPAELVPATLEGDLLPAPEGNRILTGELLSGFGGLGLVRQLGMLVGLAASVALGLSVVLWMQEPDYRPLTGNWSTYDVNGVTEALDVKGIDHKVDPQTGVLMVPADSVHQARMALASAELLGDGARGSDTLDTPQPFGMSQFAESARHQRALEAELARSIATFSSVKSARVHLAVPRNSAFLRDGQQASASVALQVIRGKFVGKTDVRAIMYLVASAVPGLATDRVAVVDQHGSLISGQDRDEAAAATDRQYEYTKRLEDDLLRKVQDILAPIAGDNRFRVQVAADVDFTWQEQTAELFNPDLSAVRSEQTLEEQRTGDAVAAGIPGALSNQPPAVSAVPETVPAPNRTAENGAAANAPTGSRREATRNFEVDRTISHTRHQFGRLNRLTVSVAVDDVPAIGEGNAVTYQPWQSAELTRLSELVKSAVGYDAARGDVVSVVNAPFIEQPAEAVVETPFWEEPWFLALTKQALGAIAIILLGFAVLRPLFRGLTSVSRDAVANAEGENDRSILEDKAVDDALNDVVSLSSAGRSLLAGGVGYGAQLDAVRGLVVEDPSRVAAVVKAWVAVDE